MAMNHTEEISKKIFKIRVAMGYATKDQVGEGWKGEMKSVKYLINTAKKTKWCASGGFSYKKQKNGDIEITPAFKFIVKKKK